MSEEHYISRIQKEPLLKEEDEYHLAKQWREHKDAKAVEKIIRSHLRLAKKIAEGYRGYGLPVNELVAEGNIGIMHAVKHFDPEKGFRFSTYAMWWIRASIQDYILKSWSLVKISAAGKQIKLFFGLRKAEREVTKGYETSELTDDTAQKIADKLGVSKKDVESMHTRLMSKDFSLNAPLTQGEDGEWIDWVQDQHETPEAIAVKKNEMRKRKDLFEEALNSLSQREHDVMRMRRLREPPKTLEAISLELGLSRERVRQIENGAFLKLKKETLRLAQANAFSL